MTFFDESYVGVVIEKDMVTFFLK